MTKAVTGVTTQEQACEITDLRNIVRTRSQDYARESRWTSSSDGKWGREEETREPDDEGSDTDIWELWEPQRVHQDLLLLGLSRAEEAPS